MPAFEWQKAQPGNQSIVIFVLSPTGDIIDSHAMDGVLPIGAETGLMKAKTALYARGSSASVAQRFNTVDGRLIRLDLGKAEGLSYYFVSGGLPIVVENQLIGAVGVGGGNADEQCAYQALTKVLGPQPPLRPPRLPLPLPRLGSRHSGRSTSNAVRQIRTRRGCRVRQPRGFCFVAIRPLAFE